VISRNWLWSWPRPSVSLKMGNSSSTNCRLVRNDHVSAVSYSVVFCVFTIGFCLQLKHFSQSSYYDKHKTFVCRQFPSDFPPISTWPKYGHIPPKFRQLVITLLSNEGFARFALSLLDSTFLARTIELQVCTHILSVIDTAGIFCVRRKLLSTRVAYGCRSNGRLKYSPYRNTKWKLFLK
jgi:uncharacterized membrane protein